MARLDPTGERWLQAVDRWAWCTSREAEACKALREALDQMEWRASVYAEACALLRQAGRQWPGFAEHRHRIATLMRERPRVTLREAYLLAVREA